MGGGGTLLPRGRVTGLPGSPAAGRAASHSMLACGALSVLLRAAAGRRCGCPQPNPAGGRGAGGAAAAHLSCQPAPGRLVVPGHRAHGVCCRLQSSPRAESSSRLPHAAGRPDQLPRMPALGCHWMPALAALHSPPTHPPPQFVVKDEPGGGQRVAGVDWRFNAWGGLEGGLYASWERDDAVAGAILQASGRLPRAAGVAAVWVWIEGGLGASRTSAAMCVAPTQAACKPTVLGPTARACPADGGRAPLPLPHCDGGRQHPRGRPGHAAHHRRGRPASWHVMAGPQLGPLPAA